jgi:hypothetical protein
VQIDVTKWHIVFDFPTQSDLLPSKTPSWQQELEDNVGYDAKKVLFPAVKTFRFGPYTDETQVVPPSRVYAYTGSRTEFSLMLGESWDYWISQKFDNTDTPIGDVWLEVTIFVHPHDYFLTQATQNRY